MSKSKSESAQKATLQLESARFAEFPVPEWSRELTLDADDNDKT